jgi:TolB-like protein/Flp pilus assembly protein TadD/tRNA A-37 threonylcarbamoyl transferase component Bud32
MSDVIDREQQVLDRVRHALADRYRVERVLGHGGMATVFHARDLRHAQRAVALKVLRPEVAEALGAERFEAEIRIAALLNHPHIVPMFDSGVADGLFYYVMPAVDAETLRERMRREPPLALPEIVRIAAGVASALSYAHAHGVVHRDIKPENIFVAGSEPILTDFGIARAVRAAGEHGTASGILLGTPGYMSPEQATGSPELDARADVFGLGCVLYEMIVGRLPYAWVDAEMVRRGRMADVDPEARARLDALPRGLEAALTRALAAHATDRFATAAEFAAALGRDDPAERPSASRSVAVLPFVCLTGDPEGAFLGDGLAEEITNALARVRSLLVASRTSAFSYRDRRADVRQIGRELGVAAILEGSVRRSGDTLRVTVQLVDVDSGYQLWSERFERDMSDVFAIQDEIARSVVRALRVIMTESEGRALARIPTSDVGAYEYWLRGRQYFHQTRKKSLEYARQMYASAIEIDPEFALAYAGIADCCALLHSYYPSSAPDVERADEASRHALELAPDLPEAHASRGFALYQLGRVDEAAAEFQTAIRLDPSQYEARYYLARQCFQYGHLSEAAHWFEDAARVEDHVEARFFAAQAHEAEGRHDQALSGYRRALESGERHLRLHPDDPRAATMQAVALCRLGDPGRGLEWARRALDIDPEDAGVRYNVACLYALEGRHEEALECLETCVQMGFGNREWIARDPDLASLRDEPRFQACVGPEPHPAGGAAESGGR